MTPDQIKIKSRLDSLGLGKHYDEAALPWSPVFMRKDELERIVICATQDVPKDIEFIVELQGRLANGEVDMVSTMLGDWLEELKGKVAG